MLMQHKRRLLVTGTFCGVYAYGCKNALTWRSETMRIGVAGSLSCIICDSIFHVVDTVNIRAKAATCGEELSTMQVARNIYSKEGAAGFTKGFSACFYGAAACGFMYFSLYKVLKQSLKSVLGEEYDLAVCYILASITACTATLTVQYPYDLIKCRFQSVNDVFKYESLPHAFKKEVSTNGARSLYRGVTPFLGTYCSFIAIQFTIYETIMTHFKRNMSKSQFS